MCCHCVVTQLYIDIHCYTIMAPYYQPTNRPPIYTTYASISPNVGCVTGPLVCHAHHHHYAYDGYMLYVKWPSLYHARCRMYTVYSKVHYNKYNVYQAYVIRTHDTTPYCDISAHGVVRRYLWQLETPTCITVICGHNVDNTIWSNMCKLC